MTSNPREAQVHMQMLMEIRAETLAEYLASYRDHFGRIVGFRPSGWNYRPEGGRLSAQTCSPAACRQHSCFTGQRGVRGLGLRT